MNMFLINYLFGYDNKLLVHEFSEISKCSDFSKALFKFTLSKTGRSITGAAFLGALNKGLPLNCTLHFTNQITTSWTRAY